ncbi:class I poly(R)-hydroxyalkanoic acid synthase [Candidatus Chlorohelix sp.]|uniref:PHA/PHB synthase family protein n=1 Tax=Candidatus Chlorohelix sp. TaxID=3139201 RepID=UPI003035E78B
MQPQDWTKLVEQTFKIPNLNGQSNQPDPWMLMIDQLWEANPYSKLLPLDPAEIMHSMQQLWTSMFSDPTKVWANYTDYLQQYNQLMVATLMKMWGQPTGPAVEPEKGDKRFNSPDWQQNIAYDALKQTYLLGATTLLKSAGSLKGLDDKQKRRITFYLRQFLDSISPTNFFFTNPQVIHETIKSGGKNLVDGLNNLLRDVKTGQIKMTDTDAFKPGVNLAITPGQVIHRSRLVEIIQYKPTTEKVYSIPVLFLPPWINKYYCLDMQPENSLIKFLVDKGFTVFVISWKNPDAQMEDIGLEGYLEMGPLTAINVIKEITGTDKINTVGYCIGGTLLSMTVPYLNAIGDDTVNCTTFFVTLQDFEEVGDTSVYIDEQYVTFIEGQMMARGYLDSKEMASMFNVLRANDLIWSNVINNYMLGKEPPAFDLLYWNADGTRMARAAHSYYLHNTYLENNLVKPGRIKLKGVPIDLSKITQDVYAVGTQQDHIVPWKSAWRITKLAGGKKRFIVGSSGHIAGIINTPSKMRGYWTNEESAETADDWFNKAQPQQGSWWFDWAEWLKARAGEQVSPPPMGSKSNPPICAAPGTYVLER